MVGIDLVPDASAPLLAQRALTEQRLVVNATGPSTIRLEPPLVVTEAEIDDAVSRLARMMD
jgi:acetylornithine/succinyldiaminopimelate/putrescine aminotransferase